jgi:hypothetical protein
LASLCKPFRLSLISPIFLLTPLGPLTGGSLSALIGFRWMMTVFAGVIGIGIFIYFLAAMKDCYDMKNEHKQRNTDDLGYDTDKEPLMSFS